MGVGERKIVIHLSVFFADALFVCLKKFVCMRACGIHTSHSP